MVERMASCAREGLLEQQSVSLQYPQLEHSFTIPANAM